MKSRKIILFGILTFLMGYIIYSYVYQSHRDIASEEGVFLVQPTVIFSEFKANEEKANQKYLDKTITVFGKISSIDFNENAVIIDDKVFTVFKDKLPQNLMKSSEIKMKGRFIGYDDLLEELKMDQCVLESN